MSYRSLLQVKSGHVRVHQETPAGQAAEITRRASGTHFGEMAFLDPTDLSDSQEKNVTHF